MTDPRILQRQLLAAKERADELEHQLDRLASKTATLEVTAEVHTELRLARLEAAVVELGGVLPAFGPVDAVLRQTAAGRIEAER